jgi:hypothetical protein
LSVKLLAIIFKVFSGLILTFKSNVKNFSTSYFSVDIFRTNF